jgi:hypothetical protein
MRRLEAKYTRHWTSLPAASLCGRDECAEQAPVAINSYSGATEHSMRRMRELICNSAKGNYQAEIL